MDVTGAQHCIDDLARESIYIRHDGMVSNENAGNLLTVDSLMWGQARRMYSNLSNALQEKEDARLRRRYSDCAPEIANRQLARLNSCAGPTSGKWLAAFLRLGGRCSMMGHS